MAIKKSHSIYFVRVGCNIIISRISKTNTLVWIKQILFQNLKIARETNLRLAGGKLVWGEYKNDGDWPKKHWAALSAANEKVGGISSCRIVVSLYNEVRTYFERNL